MPKDDFMPHDEGGKAILFCLFRDQIGQFLPVLGIAANDAEILQQAADATRYRALVDFGSSLQTSAKAWTVMKNSELLGTGTVATEFVMPVLPANFPPAVVPGIEKRFRRLVQRIKRLRGYTEAMGKQLGVIRVAPAKKDVNELLPKFTLELRVTGVFVRWSWDKQDAQADMVELVVDRNDGQGERLLTIDATPGFLDLEPFPAAPVKWTYRAIFHQGEFRIGQWSVPVSIVVGG